MGVDVGGSVVGVSGAGVAVAGAAIVFAATNPAGIAGKMMRNSPASKRIIPMPNTMARGYFSIGGILMAETSNPPPRRPMRKKRAPMTSSTPSVDCGIRPPLLQEYTTNTQLGSTVGQGHCNVDLPLTPPRKGRGICDLWRRINIDVGDEGIRCKSRVPSRGASVRVPGRLPPSLDGAKQYAAGIEKEKTPLVETQKGLELTHP